MATPAILDKLQKIPSKTRYIAFGVLVAIAVVLFIWLIRIPKKTEINKLDADIVQLQAKIAENDAKIRKLDDLRAEVKALHERLKVLTEQLPPESEVSGLLRQISALVSKAGLTALNFWKPDKKQMHSSGLYEAIPITLKLTGGYHNVAVFFDSVSRLTRIVNMQNVKMGQPKVGKNGLMEIAIEVKAVTFAAVEKKPEAAPAAAAATKQVK